MTESLKPFSENGRKESERIFGEKEKRNALKVIKEHWEKKPDGLKWFLKRDLVYMRKLLKNRITINKEPFK